MTKRADILPLPEPIGLRREVAAAYVGLSATQFDKAVEAGELPQPREILGVRVWSRMSLARALDGETSAPANPWDA